MKKLLIILITITILFAGCMSSNFTLTGDTYNSLPEDHPVKVVLTGIDDEFDYKVIDDIYNSAPATIRIPH